MKQILFSVGLLTVEISSIPYILLNSYNSSQNQTWSSMPVREGILIGRYEGPIKVYIN